ncbi:MAG: Lrp/AsnC family transcriptional regulator [Candidatus Diapherotrites archaeon]|nr:Lrp/AsnC family transcriptional regulator [Candidatus Diapherotrites archaeon]
METQLDDVDLKIIKALQKDARASLRDVAKETGVAVGTVQNRLSKLRESSVLKTFRPVINYNKLGYVIDALVAIRMHRHKHEELIKKLLKIPNVMDIFEVTGDVDLIVRVQFKDPEELKAFLHKDLTEEFILSSITYTVLTKIHKRDLIQ